MSHSWPWPHLSSSEIWQWWFPHEPCWALNSVALEDTVPPFPGSHARQTRWFPRHQTRLRLDLSPQKERYHFLLPIPWRKSVCCDWLSSRSDSSNGSLYFCWPLMSSWEGVRPAGRKGNHYIIPMLRPHKHFPSLMTGIQRPEWLVLVWSS